MFDGENEVESQGESNRERVPPRSSFKCACKKQLRMLWYSIRNINVEIIIFLVYVGWASSMLFVLTARCFRPLETLVKLASPQLDATSII